MKALFRVALSLALGYIMWKIISIPLAFLSLWGLFTLRPVLITGCLVLVWLLLSRPKSAQRAGKRTSKKVINQTEDHYKDETFEVTIDRDKQTVKFSAHSFAQGVITRTAPLGALQYARKRDSFTSVVDQFIPGRVVHNVRTGPSGIGKILNPDAGGAYMDNVGNVWGKDATYDRYLKTLTIHPKTIKRAETTENPRSDWFIAVVEGGQFTQRIQFLVEAADENPKFFEWLKKHESRFRSKAYPDDAFPITKSDRQRRRERKDRVFEHVMEKRDQAAQAQRETRALLEQHRDYNKRRGGSWQHFE